MKNCIFILLWCIPGFLFSVTPKPDVEKLTETADTYYQAGKVDSALCIIRKSKFPQNPKRSVRFLGKGTKRSVQKRKARNTQKAETKVL